MKKLFFIFLAVLLTTGCGNRAKEDGEYIKPDQNKEEQKEEQKEEKPLEEIILENMSLEEKVAQLFVVDLLTFYNEANVTSGTSDLFEKIEEYPVGGFIFFSSNLVNRKQITNLLKSMQDFSKTPLFMSIDEEGGKVSRLGNNPEMGMTKIQQASEIGKTQDERNAYQAGRTLGIELNELGFNMDFAPVADVNTNLNNPVIGNRSFSSDPFVVANMVGEEVKGLQEQKVAAVAKHFPGHGDTQTDTHTGSVTVEHDINRLKEIELIPFYKAIEEEVAGIMVAHIALPNITKNQVPASLSKQIITGILRDEMQYDGLVITDALNMKAITQTYGSNEACIQSFLAGADVLLMPEDFHLAFEGMINGVEKGEISEERINISVKRILKVKIKLNLIGQNIVGGVQ